MSTSEQTKARKQLRDMILEHAKKGEVVIRTIDGYIAYDLEEIIKQPTEGLLYDLNRDSVTVSTFLNDPKWVNDYAVGLVIGKLKEYYDKRKE